MMATGTMEQEEATPSEQGRTISRRVLVGLCVWVLGGLVFYSASVKHAEEVNTKPGFSDQSAYLDYAKRFALEKGVVVDGARGPLYPFVISHLYNSGDDSAVYFESAKSFSILLVTAAWMMSIFILFRVMPCWHSVVSWLVIGFCCVIYYAPYTKAEASYFVSNVVVFVLLVRLLQAPKLWLALSAGFALAISWMLKASALTVIAVFVPAAFLRAIAVAMRSKPEARLALIARSLAIPGLVVLVFLATASPVLNHNKEKYGQYFYNVNSTFYMWYDDWRECVSGTRAKEDRNGWPDMPISELPSAKKYWKNHTIDQIKSRIVDGAIHIAGAIRPHGMLRYISVCFLALLVSIAFQMRSAIRAFTNGWATVLFAAGYCIASAILCAWFVPINGGVRFFAAVFPCVIVSLVFAVVGIDRAVVTDRRSRALWSWGLSYALSLMLAYDVINTVLFGMRGGVDAGS